MSGFNLHCSRRHIAPEDADEMENPDSITIPDSKQGSQPGGWQRDAGHSPWRQNLFAMFGGKYKIL